MCKDQASGDSGLAQYANWWVALLAGRVIGVGKSEREAYLAAKGSRPREEPAALKYVPPGIRKDGTSVRGIPSLFDENHLAAQARAMLVALGGRAYLVGGSVRDYLMGRECHDLDFAVSKDGLEAGRTIGDALKAPFYPLDPERGVARVVVQGASQERVFIDVSTLRGGAIGVDLAARDFTINAMAVDLANLQLLDPHAGGDDLAGRRLRLVSDDGIARDPIRALRGVRQISELGFTMDPGTADVIARDGKGLEEASPERVRDELVRILALPDAASPIGRLERLGLLQWTIPELIELKETCQTAPHHLNVWDHSLLTVTRLEGIIQALLSERGQGSYAGAFDESMGPLEKHRPALRQHLESELAGGRPRWLMLKLAALLHDVGKPECQQIDESGRVRFIGHDRLGGEIAAGVIRRLRFARAEEEMIRTIVLYHMRPLMLAGGNGVTRRAAHRYYRDAGADGIDIVLLALADHLALRPGRTVGRGWGALVKVVGDLLDYWLVDDNPETVAPLVSGLDLMEVCDMPPGPDVGYWLRRIREEQISGVLHDKAEALQWVREASTEYGGASS